MIISKKILIGTGVAVVAGVATVLAKKYIENKIDEYIDDFDGDDDIECDDTDEEEVVKNNASLIANSRGIGIFDGNAVKRDMEECTNDDKDMPDVITDDDLSDYSDDPEAITQALIKYMEGDDIQKLIGQGETKLGLSLLVSKPDLSLDVEFDDGDNMVLYNNGEQVVLYDYNEDQYKFILDREWDKGKLYGYIVDTEFPISDAYIKNKKPITANLSKATNDEFLAKLKITDYDPDDIEEIGHLKVYDYKVLLANYVAFCNNKEIGHKTTFPVFLK